MQEKITSHSLEQREPSPVYGEEVVEKIHLHHDSVLEGTIPCNVELLEQVREDLTHLECYPLYKEYVEGRTPSLPLLQESAARAVAAIEKIIAEEKKNGTSDADLAEEIRVKNLIAGRSISIEQNITAYIKTVLRFQTLKKLHNNGARDVSKQLEQTDHDRRRVHNNLIDSLRILTEAVKEAQSIDLIAKKSVHEWVPSLNASELAKTEGSIVVFSPKILTDRDYVRDWAMAADFNKQFSDLQEVEQKAKEAAGK